MQHHLRERGRAGRARQAKLARTLGWFSIALGVVELVAPRAVARASGLRTRHVAGIRLCGVREIVTGVGLLTSHNAAPWLWARVAGDIGDLAGIAAASDKASTGAMVKAG